MLLIVVEGKNEFFILLKYMNSLLMKRLITVAQRHNSDIDVLKKVLAHCIEKWNEEYKNLFKLKSPDWYDKFGMVRIIFVSELYKMHEELCIVLNLNRKEIRVLAEVPEAIDINSYTLESVIKKKLREVVRITDKESE
ncbi:MAG: hypothetical protein ABI792_02640 [bacterium]